MQPTGIINKALPKNLGTPDADPALATSSLLSTLISTILVVGCVTFVFMLLAGGYLWITSAGNKEGLQKARNRITNALSGLIILLSIYAILKALGSFFDINLIQFNLPKL